MFYFLGRKESREKQKQLVKKKKKNIRQSLWGREGVKGETAVTEQYQATIEKITHAIRYKQEREVRRREFKRSSGRPQDDKARSIEDEREQAENCDLSSRGSHHTQLNSVVSSPVDWKPTLSLPLFSHCCFRTTPSATGNDRL